MASFFRSLAGLAECFTRSTRQSESSGRRKTLTVRSTGLPLKLARAGELCGLRVEDIDLNRGLVKIVQSAWHGKTPRSEIGERRADLRDFIEVTSAPPELPHEGGNQTKSTWCLPLVRELRGTQIFS